MFYCTYQDARVGLHWMSATMWSTWGAYDLTCSTWITETFHFWLSISSRISFILTETKVAHSFHSSLWSVLSKFSLSMLFAFDFLGRTRGISFPRSEIRFCEGSFFPSEFSLFGYEGLGWRPVTLPCMCINPPTSFLRAWHADTHPSSELGMRPRLILSATLCGHVWNNPLVNYLVSGVTTNPNIFAFSHGEYILKFE